ncbi:MAG: DUF2480 family protein [Saprospiraceae bacterium]|nr:DUF2480 family protein [Saprospiraceae bacterium]
MDVDQKPLINRVAASSLVTVNLEDFYPTDEIKSFDLTDYLWKGLILKEKEFRAELQSHDWTQYNNRYLCVYCSADAIIPVWAYMLIARYAEPEALDLYCGTQEEFLHTFFHDALQSFDVQTLKDKKVVIKGCSNKPVPTSAYFELTKVLRPLVQSIMYGEPCSTVPIYKKPTNSA